MACDPDWARDTASLICAFPERWVSFQPSYQGQFSGVTDNSAQGKQEDYAASTRIAPSAALEATARAMPSLFQRRGTRPGVESDM